MSLECFDDPVDGDSVARITSDALTTTITGRPAARPSSSAASLVIDDVVVGPPWICTFTVFVVHTAAAQPMTVRMVSGEHAPTMEC
jgi:hypothetical protein